MSLENLCALAAIPASTCITHFQPAQPTTVGKRATLWIQELLMDLEDLLSNHCAADVIAGFSASIITYLAREAILSLLIGFLL